MPFKLLQVVAQVTVAEVNDAGDILGTWPTDPVPFQGVGAPDELAEWAKRIPEMVAGLPARETPEEPKPNRAQRRAAARKPKTPAAKKA